LARTTPERKEEIQKIKWRSYDPSRNLVPEWKPLLAHPISRNTGAIWPHNATTAKVIKCDLCGGKPACAQTCPTGAITYVDAQWTGYERMRAWAGRTDAVAEQQA
jgi:Fe-S-cluster-containing hydrogenase component 2